MKRFSALSVIAAAKSLQSCLTLCDPIDGSPPGSPIPGILQARTLQWVAISFSNAWKWKVKVKSLSRVRLFATPWTAAYQAPPSMGFARQEYWSWVPLPSPYWLLGKYKLKPPCDITIHLVEWLKLKTLTTPSFDKYGERLEFSYAAGRGGKWCNHLGRQLGSFLIKHTLTMRSSHSTLRKESICPKTFAWTVMAILFVITETLKQPKCLLEGGCGNICGTGIEGSTIV